MRFELDPPAEAARSWLLRTRESIRSELGRYREFRRGGQEYVTDQFVEDGLMATYDSEGTVMTVEFMPPASVSIGGSEIVGIPEATLRRILEGLDARTTEFDSGIDVPDWQISFYIPDGVVAGVTIEDQS